MSRAGVQPLVLLGQVVAPVVVEVAVADHCAQGEDSFGAVQSPAGAGHVHTVFDEMPAGSFDDAGGDWRLLALRRNLCSLAYTE